MFTAVIAFVVTSAPGWPEVKQAVLQPRGLPGLPRGDPRGVPPQHQDLPRRGAADPPVRAPDRHPSEPSRPCVLPAEGVCGRVRGPLPRHPDHPRHLHARLRHPGARAVGGARSTRSSGASSRSCSSTPPTCPRSTARGSSRCTRARRRLRARSGSHARQVPALRRAAAGGAARDPAASERLHRPPEGHRARRRCSGSSRPSASLRSRWPATFNYTPYLVTAILFILADDPARAAHRLARRARPAPAARHRRRAVTDAAALRLEGVHKSFGKHEVLKGIDLELAPHEVVCLIGASGLRQVDAPSLRQPPGADRRGARRSRRRRNHRAGRRPSTASGAASASSSRPSTSSRT